MSVNNIFLDAKADNSESIEAFFEENRPDERNEVGVTGLQICASNGCLSSAAAYLKHGASIFYVDRESGWTALHRSIYAGHITVSLLLSRAGAILDGEEAVRDKEGLSPMDLLSIKLSCGLESSRRDLMSSSVWSFGKSDFILGVPLPKASEVVLPRRIDSLAEKCIVQTCASKYHSCALTREGDIYTWGHGKSGRLGHGSEVGQPEPVLISFFKLKHVLVKQVASGENHTIVVTRQGDVYTWGSDRLGQLGHGNTQTQARAEPEGVKGDKGSTSTDACLLVPKRVEALRREFVLEVAAGDGHSVCHTEDGCLYAWGSNKSGQLGLKPTELTLLPGGGQGINIPKKVFVEALSRGRTGSSAGHPIPGRIVQIAASHNNTMLLCTSNTTALLNSKGTKEVYQWGHGIFSPMRVVFKEKKARTFSLGAESGGAKATEASAFQPVGHIGLVNIVQVAPGQHHFAGLSADGCVYSWSVSSSSTASGGVSSASIGPERLEERVDERVQGREGLSNPRLVEGMLSANGGGWVVSIAAACNRFCAVTDVGDLYTWSSTQGKSARTEAIPRRVATVKRAVAVSAAVDHTLVLCAYSLPELPLASHPMFLDCCSQTGRPVHGARDSVDQVIVDAHEGENAEAGDEGAADASTLATSTAQQLSGAKEAPFGEEAEEESTEEESIPSLMDLCQREVAKSVTMKTVVSALSFAEQFSAGLLAEYCHNYVSLNFDAVLAQTKPAEIDKYVDSWGYGDFSGKGRSSSTLGLSNRSAAPSPSIKTKPLAVRAQESTSGRSGATKKELPNTTEEVRKQMRAVKKKLSAISELEGKVAGEKGFILSGEQAEKMSKKQELFAEYAHLEQLLVRCETRERSAASFLSVESIPSAELSPSSPPKDLAPKLPEAAAAPVPECVDAPTKAQPQPSATAVSRAQETTTPKKGKGKGKGISLTEFNRIVESSGGKVPTDFSAWGKAVDRKTSTRADMVPAVPAAQPQTRSSPWGITRQATHAPDLTPAIDSSTAVRPAVAPHSAETLSTEDELKTRQVASNAGRGPFTPITTPTKLPTPTEAAAPAVATDLGAPRRTRALLDFLPSSKQAAPPVTPPAKSAGWAASSTPTPAGIKSPPPAVLSVSKPVRFSDIQRIEESARKASSVAALQGNSSPWYVERRRRADSMEEVVRQQAWDKAEEEEIARAVAEIDRIALLTENAAKTKAAGSRSKKKSGGARPGQPKKKHVTSEMK